MSRTVGRQNLLQIMQQIDHLPNYFDNHASAALPFVDGKARGDLLARVRDAGGGCSNLRIRLGKLLHLRW